ncbi:MAG TPA: hypothetical protein VF157_07335 [Chloroflexota bacterium]
MTSLSLALAILCAFSQVDCQTAQRVTITQTATYPGGLAWYDHPHQIITISDTVRHPAIIASLLAHETRNAQDDWTRGLQDCVANENANYGEQYREWVWFLHTFGPPALTTPDEMAYANQMAMLPLPQQQLAAYSCSIAKP